MFRGMWKVVETKAREIRVGKLKRRRIKKGERKQKKEENKRK